MTFAEIETSRSLGLPITLFRFGFGTRVYAYTDSEQSVTFGGTVYQPIPCDRDSVTASGTLDKSNMTIRLPIGTEIAELFRVFPPSDVVGVTIFQGHGLADEDADYLAVFVGRVLSGGRKGLVSVLNCEPASTSMRRPGLRRRWQYGCMHALYGPQCRADRASHTFNATVVTINRAFVTITGSGFDPAKLLGGLIQWDGPNGVELRNILQVDGMILLVSGRLGGLTVGEAVAVSLGCAHTMTDCLDVFNNIHNFGGDPWIPLKSPLGFVNQFG